MEDSKIVTLYWERSQRAIAETAKKYGAYCYRIAHNILHNEQDAEECVNDTWVRAWGAIPPQEPQCLLAFLGKITRRLALDRYKAAGTQKRGGGELTTVLEEWQGVLPPELSAEHIDLKTALDRFLHDLPALRRRLFVQRYWYMLSVKEIARDNALGESNVKMQLLRTREMLKEFLEKEGIYV